MYTTDLPNLGAGYIVRGRLYQYNGSAQSTTNGSPVHHQFWHLIVTLSHKLHPTNIFCVTNIKIKTFTPAYSPMDTHAIHRLLRLELFLSWNDILSRQVTWELASAWSEEPILHLQHLWKHQSNLLDEFSLWSLILNMFGNSLYKLWLEITRDMQATLKTFNIFSD